jgi:hypothetical protein
MELYDYLHTINEWVSSSCCSAVGYGSRFCLLPFCGEDKGHCHLPFSSAGRLSVWFFSACTFPVKKCWGGLPP